MDIISLLPLGIIETILCFLPIQDAARTSILSKEWRYRWTRIPKLVFIGDKYYQASDDGAELSVLEQVIKEEQREMEIKAKRCKLFFAIYQVLLMHQGPIHEFTLDIKIDSSCVEIDHILLHLSKRNTVKILKLDFLNEGYGRAGYSLPISLFSFHQLTDLYLVDCDLWHERPFNEFGCLTTLYLGYRRTTTKTLLRLLSCCPLLKRLTLTGDDENLFNIGDSTIVDLFKCLPVIEYLTLLFCIVKVFVLDRLPKELPTTLVHLKYLCVNHVCLSHKYALPFLLPLIRSSPNLEKLKLELYNERQLKEDEMGSFTPEDYSDFLLEHLNELKISYFSNSENEFRFLEAILAKSPVLKKVRIFSCGRFRESEISKILSHFPCASPVVKIIITRMTFKKART